MPPKSSSKKSGNTTTWFHCEKCDVHITSKERDTHEKVCPIGETKATTNGFGLEYIGHDALHTCSVERKTFNTEELSELPAKHVNQLIFISEGAMRLANFHIGQPVVIYALEREEMAPLVRNVWPVPEKFLTTIFTTPDDFQLHWEHIKGTSLKIQSLPSAKITAAKQVHLQQVNSVAELNSQQIRDVERILKYEMKSLIYRNGSLIHLNFFNKSLDFSIVSWDPINPKNNSELSLERALENLQLNNENTPTFLQVVASTQICVDNQLVKDREVEEPSTLITKENIGGLDEQLRITEEAMQTALGMKELPKGVKISRGLLLYGSTGCGKTMICEAMANSLRSALKKSNVIRINTGELFSKFLGETEKNLSLYFERAYSDYPNPSLIIIEDVHNICPKHETNDVVKRVSVSFLSMLDAMSSRREAQHTFLLATTSNIDALNGSIRRCGRLDTEVEIGAPSASGRLDILKCLLRKVDHKLNESEMKDIAQVTHGFVGADLANLIYSASMSALKSSNHHLNAQEIRNSLSYIKPSAMREVLIENPNVRWADIGGQHDLKLKLKQAIEWPLLHPEKFQRLGIKPPRGILMFGPPGCSKTMVAKALATESQLNFLSIKGPELFSMWVGESERAVREVFRKARQVAPSIVFFDEIDAIGGERSDGGSGSSVKERVLTQLLTEMDGVESLQDVTIVAATNRPDMIDKALLRPGRIDRIVYVGLPDQDARREIFRIKLSKMPLASDVDVEQLVHRTEGYSGAEIQAVCHEAALKTLEGNFDAEQVTWPQFEYALSVVQPRTSPELLSIYEEYMKKS